MKLKTWMITASPLVFAAFLGGCNACTEQHDPRADRALFEVERESANAPTPKLNEDGSYPATSTLSESQDSSATVAAVNPAAQKYKQFCAACHGETGAADGAAAAAMNPKPRNLTLASWQESVDNEHIYKVIKEGGTSVGLSATMAPWGGVLSDDDVTQMVEYVRSLKKD